MEGLGWGRGSYVIGLGAGRLVGECDGLWHWMLAEWVVEERAVGLREESKKRKPDLRQIVPTPWRTARSASCAEVSPPPTISMLVGRPAAIFLLTDSEGNVFSCIAWLTWGGALARSSGGMSVAGFGVLMPGMWGMHGWLPGPTATTTMGA